MKKLKSLAVVAVLCSVAAGSAYAVDVSVIVQNKNATSPANRLTSSTYSMALPGTTYSPARTESVLASTTAPAFTARNTAYPNNQNITEYYSTATTTCKFYTSFLIISGAPQYTYTATNGSGGNTTNCTATLTAINPATNAYTVTFSIK